jgi:hypothetical protein
MRGAVNGVFDPGRVFDLTLPLDERRAIKTRLCP